MKVYCHPRCSTCKKALKYLDENNVDYTLVNLLEETPSVEELEQAYNNSGVTLKKMFNTSGKAYRESGMKDQIPNMSENDVFNTLASDGMLIKRPLVIKDDLASFGFKEEDFKKYIG